jgi:hypothetical protein
MMRLMQSGLRMLQRTQAAREKAETAKHPAAMERACRPGSISARPSLPSSRLASTAPPRSCRRSTVTPAGHPPPRYDLSAGPPAPNWGLALSCAGPRPMPYPPLPLREEGTAALQHPPYRLDRPSHQHPPARGRGRSCGGLRCATAMKCRHRHAPGAPRPTRPQAATPAARLTRRPIVSIHDPETESPPDAPSTHLRTPNLQTAPASATSAACTAET